MKNASEKTVASRYFRFTEKMMLKDIVSPLLLSDDVKELAGTARTALFSFRSPLMPAGDVRLPAAS